MLDDGTSTCSRSSAALAEVSPSEPLLRERALVGSIILHESEPGVWARASTAAVMERLDPEWLRRLSLELPGACGWW